MMTEARSMQPRTTSLDGLAAIGGVASFVGVVVTLHFAQPGYDPSTQLMSELALGRYGGAMIVAFAGLSVAVFGIQHAIGALGGGKGLRALFLGASASFLAAGLFPLGATTEVHLAAIAAAFILSVLAMYLFPATAGSASQLLPRMVSWGLAAGVALSIALGLFLIPMGVAQRAAACFLLVWLTLIGWRLASATQLGRWHVSLDSKLRTAIPNLLHSGPDLGNLL